MCPYCSQYRLPSNISRREEQMAKVVTGGLRVKMNVFSFGVTPIGSKNSPDKEHI